MGANGLSWLEEMNRPAVALASIQSTVRSQAVRKQLSDLESRVRVIERRLGPGPECVAEEPPLPRLVTMVANYYCLPPERLTGREREQRFTWPRHVSWYLARRYLGLTLSEIVEHFGLRCHAGVLHGLKHVEQVISVVPKLKLEVSALEKLVEDELL